MIEDESFGTNGAVETVWFLMGFFMPVAGVFSGEGFLTYVALEWAVCRWTSVF